MKKSLLLFLLLPLFAFSVAEWVTVNMDHHVSIQFPAQPEVTSDDGMKTWRVDQEEYKCAVFMLDFSMMGIDSAGLAAELENPTVIDEFTNSMLSEMGASTVLVKETTTVSGRPAFRYKIDMSTEDDKFTILHCDIIFVGEKMYALYFFEQKEKEKPADRKKFLGSFKVR